MRGLWHGHLMCERNMPFFSFFFGNSAIKAFTLRYWNVSGYHFLHHEKVLLVGRDALVEEAPLLRCPAVWAWWKDAQTRTWVRQLLWSLKQTNLGTQTHTQTDTHEAHSQDTYWHINNSAPVLVYGLSTRRQHAAHTPILPPLALPSPTLYISNRRPWPTPTPSPSNLSRLCPPPVLSWYGLWLRQKTLRGIPALKKSPLGQRGTGGQVQ